jgi:hypothetical protein
MSQDNKEHRLGISRMSLVGLVSHMGLGDVVEPELYGLEVFGLDWMMILKCILTKSVWGAWLTLGTSGGLL